MPDVAWFSRAPALFALCVATLGLSVFDAPAALAAQAAAKAAAEGDRRVLVMEVKPGEEIPPDLAPALTDLVSGRVAQARSLQVVSSSEIAQVLGLEGKKQLLGCSQNVCLTDIANTLGARYVIFGRVNALGNLKVLQLRLFDASEARFLQRITLRGEDIVALSEQIPASVDSLIAGLLDPSERRALLALRAASAPAKVSGPADAHSLPSSGDGVSAETGPSPLLVAGLGSLATALLAVSVTGVAGYYFSEQYSDAASPYAQREQAKNTGTLVVVAGSAGSLALLGLGAALVVMGAQ